MKTINSPKYWINLKRSTIIVHFDKFKIKPIYESFPGWKTKTQGIRNISDLPENAKKYIYALEDFIGAKVSSISTSPEREDTILIEDPFKS